MENPVGRLDLLLLGIVERIASANPLAHAAFQVFEPEIRSALKPLDSPRLRRMIRQAAPRPERKKRPPKLGARQVKRISPAQEPVPVVEAEWVS